MNVLTIFTKYDVGSSNNMAKANNAYMYTCTISLQHVPSRAVHLGMSLTDGATFLSACSMSIVIFRVVVTIVANLKGVSRVMWYGLGSIVGGVDAFIMVIFKTYQGQLAGSIVNGLHIGTSYFLNANACPYSQHETERDR